MRKWQVLICAGLILSVVLALPAYGKDVYGVNDKTGRWQEIPLCRDLGGCESETGKETAWYYLDSEGVKETGWVYADGYWYFLNTAEGSEKGRMLTGWQWIDGRCYYLAEVSDPACPLGAMYAGGKTPDGYTVGVNGAWVDDSGAEQVIPGKGFSSAGAASRIGLKTRGGSSASGGGSGGGGNGGGFVKEEEALEEEAGPLEEEAEAEEEPWEEVGKPSEEVGKPSEEVGKPSEEENWAEGGNKDDSAEDGAANGDGTEGDDLAEDINPATPSEARKVLWEVSFVEESDRNQKVFRTQSGEFEEGTEIFVDFPERIETKDGWIYQALEKSPKRITAAGTGIQKYAVLFRKEEQEVEEPEKDEGEERLSAWIETARETDRALAGERPEPWQVITNDRRESRERLLNLVSMVSDGARHEIYVIARNHIPSTVDIGQTFPDVTGISELLMDEILYGDDCYRVIRVGFERTWNQESCIHDMEARESAAAGCDFDGYERSRCRRCGYEETVYYPAAGHLDQDMDGVCEICYMNLSDEGVNGKRLYQEGDIQIRNIGGKQYRFRCIDEDYEDSRDNRGYTALFLCETVIRSDLDAKDGASRKLNFGSDNNYKTSNVRAWLRENTENPADDISAAYTGVNTAYLGSTGKGDFQQFSFDDLEEREKPFQMMEDRMFILSLEEAVKYRDYLWKFQGSMQNNPESQYSPYSRGYYLRTPGYEGEECFQYGTAVYAVDLLEGRIYPADVSGTDMGIRPAYTVSQNREQAISS